MLNRLKSKIMLPLLVAMLVTGATIAQAATPTPAPTTAPQAQGQFVANKKVGKPFHKVTCSSAKKLKAANAVYFATREEAIKAGHTPCKICKP